MGKGDQGKGKGKKKAAGKHSLDPNRANKDARLGVRSAATVKRLKMYRARPKRDAKGKKLSEEYQSKELPSTRIQPDPRWFGNTRVIDQDSLQRFQQNYGEKLADPFAVVLKQKKLPLSLIKEETKGKRGRVDLLRHQTFQSTFGPAAQRKKPKLAVGDYALLAARAEAGERR